MPRSDPPTSEEYVSAARRACADFGLNPVSVEPLSRSENVVCKVVDADGVQRVMRLHRPGYNSLAELESEVAWVRSLADAGVPVPTTMPAIAGGHYVETLIGRESRYVGVVEWVSGAPLGEATDPGSANLVRSYRTIGELAAKIRAHHERWTPPSGFVRRRWDSDGLVGESPSWGRFWDVANLTPDDRALFRRSRDVIKSELDALPTSPDRFGLIHADLHLGNLMADGDGLTVIDFDDAGFGWFVHELAVALHPILDAPWFGEARRELLTGYRSVHPLTEAEEDLIDTFLTLRSLMLISWLDDRRELPNHGDYFDELVTSARTVASRFLTDGTLG